MNLKKIHCFSLSIIVCGLFLLCVPACSGESKQEVPLSDNSKKAVPPTKQQTILDSSEIELPINEKNKVKTIAFVPPVITNKEEKTIDYLQNESVLEVKYDPFAANSKNSKAPNPTREYSEAPILIQLEDDASFPGGHVALLDYIRKNMRYPQDAIEKEITGKCYVQFVVKSDGSIGNVKMLRSVYPSIDNEAIRLIKGMPNWIPAQLDGKNVNSYYNLPIKFALD